MEIAYTAYTETAAFLLDDGGFCRKVVPVAGVKGARAQAQAERCLGAQYVASLDVQVPGGLVELPREGVPLLFAIADAGGRISLIRTAVLVRFETKRKTTSGVHELRTPIEPIMIPAAARPQTHPADDDSEEVATVRRHPRPLKNPGRTLSPTPVRPVAAPVRLQPVAPVGLQAPTQRRPPPPLPAAAQRTRGPRITPDSSSEILIPWRDTTPDPTGDAASDDPVARDARRADLADLAGVDRVPAPVHRRRRYG